MGGQGQHSDSADGNKILIITIQAVKCLAIYFTYFSTMMAIFSSWPQFFYSQDVFG